MNPNLPLPHFIDRDPQTIVSDIVAQYQDKTGKTLYPAQIERLWTDIIAYRETLLREGIQDAAMQNLVRFARAPMLDYLGEFYGVSRLPAQQATTTLRFSLESALDVPLPIPAGTRVEDNGGTVTFATDTDALISVGQLGVEAIATAEEEGNTGNGWQPGQIANLVDEFEVDLSAANVTVTANGYDEEDDERLRERIYLAPEAFTVAGPVGSYIYLAKSTHQSIVDVAVTSPIPGTVTLHILTDSGVPNANLLDQVYAVCSAEERRPLCDTVEVHPTTAISYEITVELIPYTASPLQNTLSVAEANAMAFARNISSKQGRDVVLGQIESALLSAGVKKVVFTSPTEDIPVGKTETASCTAINISMGEAEDE
ncbi:MAG: baseplate J/gp47 family protein [Burkholderiaceae bacterium]|nr:baseplate J/gp47 family protein [Burkholderiaceae bacterium]